MAATPDGIIGMEVKNRARVGPGDCSGLGPWPKLWTRNGLAASSFTAAKTSRPWGERLWAVPAHRLF